MRGSGSGCEGWLTVPGPSGALLDGKEAGGGLPLCWPEMSPCLGRFDCHACEMSCVCTLICVIASCLLGTGIPCSFVTSVQRHWTASGSSDYHLHGTWGCREHHRGRGWLCLL